MQLLDDRAAAILEKERALLRELSETLALVGGNEEILQPLKDMIERLDAFFLVVIVGEFNAGKSTVVNALFGESVMEEGPVPTTAKITLLRHGDSLLTHQRSEYVEEKRLPHPFLQYLTLVDTPGTNSIVREHQRITEDFVPRSDLVLFVTSYDRPLSESERQFLNYIREDWGRRLVVVLNKSDLAASTADLDTVLTYLETHLEDILGTLPSIYPVSARETRRAFQSDSPSGLPPAGTAPRNDFPALRDLFQETLAGPERVALKLAAPIETLETRLDRLDEHLARRQSLLSDDQALLGILREEVDRSRDALVRSYKPYLQRIDERMAEVQRRGAQFLEDTIRASISKIQLLRNEERLRSVFRDRVMGSLDRDINDLIGDAVDALMNESTTLQAELLSTFNERARNRDTPDRPSLDRSFRHDRERVVRGIAQETRSSMEVYDLERESARIVENAHDAVNTFLGTGAGAAGLGVIGTVLLVVAPVLDVVGGFGLATGAILALLGASVLPRQRRKAVREFKDRVAELKSEVQSTLQATLERDVDRTLKQVWATVEPFQTYVHEEENTLEQAQASSQRIRKEAQTLRVEIDDIAGTSDL